VGKNIYLDNSATTPLTDSVKKYLISILDDFGNPSSMYSLSEKPKQIISNARQAVSKFINADSNDIYFTSSGSASNTLAVNGFWMKNDCTIFYSPIAHKSILKCVESYHNSIPLKVNKEGLIDIHDLEEYLDVCINTPLVVIDHANSEIGTIQDIEQIIKITRLYNGIVYLDCTGSIPTIPIDVKKLDVDMIGFSAHKLGGLKGCGVLYKKKDIVLEPLVYGSQEKGIFGGTENVLGIASLGKAVEEYNYSSISSADRDCVWNYIKNNIPEVYLVGSSFGEHRLPKNLNICFPKCEAESLMILLDTNGICVSVGSACSSGELVPSPTLVAIGMDESDIHSCIRLTFSGKETKEELDCVCKTLKQCVESLRSFNKE
jgi:cysteine desulfurase